MMCCSDLQNWISTYSRCCTSKNSVKYQGGGKIWILCQHFHMLGNRAAECYFLDSGSVC
ncbi:hypothetical protein KY289_000987 [Solanum tuberosum]|nr:hypothetical protein KY289_000987 [Solanum tuberosum]